MDYNDNNNNNNNDTTNREDDASHWNLEYSSPSIETTTTIGRGEENPVVSSMASTMDNTARIMVGNYDGEANEKGVQGNEQLLAEDPPKSIFHMLMFSIFFFGNSVFQSNVLGVTLPMDIVAMVGEKNKTLALGIVTMIASLIAMVAGPLSGTISDRLDSLGRMGRRKPFIFIGTFVTVASLIARCFFVTPFLLILYSACFIVGTVSSAVAFAPYHGLFPELYPMKQYGTISGMLGAMNLFGNVFGIALGFFYSKIPSILIACFISIVYVASLIPLLFIREPTKQEILEKKEREKRIEQMQQNNKRVPKRDRVASSRRNTHQKSSNLQIEETYGSLLNDDDDILLHDQVNLGIPIYHDHHNANNGDNSNQSNDNGNLSHLNVPSNAHDISMSSNDLPLWRQRFHRFKMIVWDFIKPFLYRDYTLVFISSFLFQMGITAVQSYFLYYIIDCLPKPYVFIIWDNIVTEPQEALAVYMIITFILSIFSSIIGGLLSDKIGRKSIILFSGIITSITQLVVVFFPNLNLLMISASILGTSIGAYYSVTLGLTADVLPNKDESAKDLGIANLTHQIPSVLSPVFGAALISIGRFIHTSGIIRNRNLGYIVLYTVSVLSEIIGVVCVIFVKKGTKVRGRRKAKRKLNLQD